MSATLAQRNEVVVQPVQWTAIENIDDMKPIGGDDYVVLEEIRQIILKHGYENRFGVCLIHKHFDVGADEVLLETTDELSRVSTTTVVPKSDAKGSWETSWKFDAQADVTRACRTHCHGFGLMGHRKHHDNQRK